MAFVRFKFTTLFGLLAVEIAVSAGPFPTTVNTIVSVWNLTTGIKPAPPWGAFRRSGLERRGVAPNTLLGTGARYLASDFFVGFLYRDFLLREGSPAEIQAWANLINAQTLTRAETALQFFNSPEYQRSYATITRYYLGLLNRVLRPLVDATDEIGLTFSHAVGPLGTYYVPESVGSGAA